MYVIKTTIFSDRLRYFKSKSHKHKKEYGTVVRKYEFIKAEIIEVNYILIDAIEDCTKNIFIHLCIDVYTIVRLYIRKITR